MESESYLSSYVLSDDSNVTIVNPSPPKEWGSILHTGYGLSLFMLPLKSILLLYGSPIGLIAVIVFLRRRRMGKNLDVGNQALSD